MDEKCNKGHSTSVNNGSNITEEEAQFGRAMDDYRRRHHLRFLTYSEMLKVAKSLGYEKRSNPPPG